MAHSLSAEKRIRQNAKRKARNRWRTRTMRDAVREFLDKVAHGTPEDAAASFRKVSQVIDRTAQKGVIHKNQAARRKSRLSKRLTVAGAAGAAGAGKAKSKPKPAAKSPAKSAAKPKAKAKAKAKA